MKIKFCFLCYKGISSIKNHLITEHNNFNIKDYYDKFFKKDTDGFCLNCNKPIEFNYTKIQYNAYCSNYCMKHSEVYKQRCSDGVKKVWKIRTNCEKELIFSKGIETAKKDPNYIVKKQEQMKNLYKNKTKDEIENIRKNNIELIKNSWNKKTPNDIEQITNKRKNTCELLYNNKNYNNREKSKETCFVKYGSEYWASSDVGRKYISKSLLNMNVENKNKWINNVKKSLENRTKEEIELSNKKRLETFNSRTDEQKEKTNIKYKTTWSFKTKEELNAIHSKQLKNRRTYKYKYFGISFHSYDEMSFYIYNVECENNVVYRNDGDFCLPYEFNDKIYFYYPDFIIDNKIIEIKGLQFFKDKNPNNVMICPFHKKDDTLETIENRNKKAESKHQCMLRNNVEIITDCSKYMQYTKSKYGNKVVIGE